MSASDRREGQNSLTSHHKTRDAERKRGRRAKQFLMQSKIQVRRNCQSIQGWKKCWEDDETWKKRQTTRPTTRDTTNSSSVWFSSRTNHREADFDRKEMQRRMRMGWQHNSKYKRRGIKRRTVNITPLSWNAWLVHDVTQKGWIERDRRWLSRRSLQLQQQQYIRLFLMHSFSCHHTLLLLSSTSISQTFVE